MGAPPAFAGSDQSVPLEQLCWLVSLGGHVLADLAEGETPLVPLPIVQACKAAESSADGGNGGSPADSDPAQLLSAGLLAVGQHCLDHAGQAAASPR